jgi:hypothetical protein
MMDSRAPDRIQPSLLSALENSYKHTSALSAAATVSMHNFRWLQTHRLRHIPLLDFDIICGASPRLGIQKRLSQEADYTEYGLLGNYGGTTSVRYLLGVMKDYVLPPGTAIELLTRKRNLSDRLSERATALVERVEVASRTGDPVAALTSPAAPNIFREDLTRFSEDVGENALLDRLIARATPVDDILGDEPVPNATAVSALRAAYGYLQLARPGYSMNNLNDALNAALVERLFNAPPRGRDTPIPVLVSQTRVVLSSLKEIARDRLRSDARGELPTLINDTTYLVVSENLVLRGEGRYSRAADEAEQLAFDAYTVAAKYGELLELCQDLLDRGVRERDIGIDDMPVADWEELLYFQSRFEKQWGSMLAPTHMVAEADAVEYLNELRNANWAHLMKKDVAKLDRSLRQISAELQERQPPEREMWEIILTREAQQGIGAAFFYSLQTDHSGLLRDVNGGLLPKPYDPAFFAGDHDVLIAAIPSYVSCGAALMIGTYRQMSISPVRYVRVTWPHVIDARDLVRTVFNTLKSAGLLREGAHGVVCTSKQLIDVSLDSDDPARELIAAMDGTADHECVQMYAPDVRFFADTVPLDGLEFQVGLRLSEESWAVVAPYFPALISSTNEVKIPEENARIVVREVCKFLGLSEVQSA